MVTIFSILLTVAFFGAIKVVVALGVDANINAYFSMLGNLPVVEVALWFAIAIAGRNVLQDAKWLNSTHESSVSSHLVEKEDGTLDEIVTSRWAQTPSYESAKKSFKQSTLCFIAAASGLTVFYFL